MERAQERGREAAEELELTQARERAGGEAARCRAAIGGERLEPAVERRGHEEERADYGPRRGRGPEGEQCGHRQRVSGKEPEAARADRRSPAADRQAAVGVAVAPDPRRRARPEYAGMLEDGRPGPAGGSPCEAGRRAQYVPALPMMPLKIIVPMNRKYSPTRTAHTMNGIHVIWQRSFAVRGFWSLITK